MRKRTEKPVYITTTLPYVNAEPHIGFALEIVQADALVRYKRSLGYDVFFNSGTDEHGQKIWEKIQETKQDPQSYVDQLSEVVKDLKESLHLSYDRFVRTTDTEHQAAAQSLWRLCDKNGDIYKKKFKGLYCVGCEQFLTARDLGEDGTCPLHPGKEPIEVEEDNYFFRLSKYQDELAAYLNEPGIIMPEHRRKEALNFIENGLEDFSISREREKLPWGVPVPGDEDQVMYVWFDALTNYISTLGWPSGISGNFDTYWQHGTTIQMAGKDQVRFQSIMWQAMLTSAGIKRTDRFFYHGFINSGGHRMSKSLGNVISPIDLVKRYGIDGTRYILLRHIHAYDDTDVTWERLDEWFNAHLANGLGNLTARIMKMAETHIERVTQLPRDPLPEAYCTAIENFEFHRAAEVAWEHIGVLDERITNEEPFKLVKTEPERAKQTIRELVSGLYLVSEMLYPITPETSSKIKLAITANKKPDTLFARIEGEEK